ncbi:MAG: hypothetical protein K6F10_02345 [Paludibacteraceae bacterium]|nr:hypothetical protein [Paludibacteraceae bacterium]
MKNKLLVSVCAMAVAAFAFTSCETKSEVTDVCTNMVKESLHKSARSLQQLDGQTLTISEYEFLGGVNDNRLLYRTISFGNLTGAAKVVDTLTYEYGEWQEHNTVFTLLVTPRVGDPYVLKYRGNGLITPDGRVIGGEGLDNSARVEKWEKTIASFPNTDWEATFKGEFVTDSIFEDSIRTTFIPPATFKKDTIKVFKGKMDTLSADTMCFIRFEVNRDPATNANTGHYYKRSIRSTYDRDTKDTTIVSDIIKEYDCTWFFSDVSSDAKFTIIMDSGSKTLGTDELKISKYKTDDAGKAEELLLGGLTFTRPANP